MYIHTHTTTALLPKRERLAIYTVSHELRTAVSMYKMRIRYMEQELKDSTLRLLWTRGDAGAGRPSPAASTLQA